MKCGMFAEMSILSSTSSLMYYLGQMIHLSGCKGGWPMSKMSARTNPE